MWRWRARPRHPSVRFHLNVHGSPSDRLRTCQPLSSWKLRSAPLINAAAILVLMLAVLWTYSSGNGRAPGFGSRSERQWIASIATPPARPDMVNATCLSSGRVPEQPIAEPRETYDDAIPYLRLRVVDS